VLDFPPPPLETFEKFPALETSTGVFLADFPWAFIFAFSVLIVELIFNMPVSEDETALTRGRIPCYMRRQIFELMSTAMDRTSQRSCLRLFLNHPGLLSRHRRSRRRNRRLLEDIYGLLYYHYTSYDMVVRPTILFEGFPVQNPVDEFSSYGFYQECGFWPSQLQEVIDNLILLPDNIVCQRTRVRATKSLAIFLMLRRWKKADKWEDVARTVRRGRVWCIQMYRITFSIVSQHYRRCVQVIDYRRIVPLLEEWSDQLVWHCDSSSDVLFFTDGKPWKMCRPGTGDAAAALAAVVGANDMNLVQRAYYNGHYGFCGAKVQHVLQADGICYSFTCPLRRHDASVLQSSSMLTMLSVLHVNNDPLRPVKCCTDKAYGRTRHLRPLHTDLELRLMNPGERAVAEEEDRKNRGPRVAVEMSFNNIVRKFTHTDYFPRHRILQNGRSNWPYLRNLWDLQVFFSICSLVQRDMGILVMQYLV